MSANVIFNVLYVLVLLVMAGALWRLTRPGRPPEAARVAAARVRTGFDYEDGHDVGPDALRLLEDLDAHLDQQFTALAGLYERVGPPSPDLAGLERLRQAVRDQQNGEQA